MVRKLTALAALIPAIFAAAPAHGADTLTGFNAPNSASTMFFVSIPLDGKTRKERETGYGFALQGKQQAFVVDTRVLKNNFGIETLAGIELKWLIAGAAAAATAAAVGSSSGSRTEAQTTAQATQQAAVASGSSPSTTSSTAPSSTTPSSTSTSSTGTRTTTTTTASTTTVVPGPTGATSGVTSPGIAPCTLTPTCP